MSDPSEPLDDPKRELYARARAIGTSPSPAYRAHIARQNTTAASVKAAAWKIDNMPEVAARIGFLRQQYTARMELPDELDGAEIGALMHEVTAALQTAHDVAEATGVASESELSRLRQRLIIHLNRLHRSGAPEKEKTRPEMRFEMSGVSAPHWCSCE